MYFKYSKLAENEFDKKMIELTEEYQAFIKRNVLHSDNLYHDEMDTYNKNNYFDHFPMGLYIKLKDLALREIELEKHSLNQTKETDEEYEL